MGLALGTDCRTGTAEQDRGRTGPWPNRTVAEQDRGRTCAAEHVPPNRYVAEQDRGRTGPWPNRTAAEQGFSRTGLLPVPTTKTGQKQDPKSQTGSPAYEKVVRHQSVKIKHIKLEVQSEQINQ